MLTAAKEFFSIHPTGTPLQTEHNGIIYEDLDDSTKCYDDHSLNRSTDPALDAICKQAGALMDLDTNDTNDTNV